MGAQRQRHPVAQARLPGKWLAVAAAFSLGLWLTVELILQPPTHARFPEMLNAARTVQAASRVLRAEKEARGLMAPPEADPNRTGMIGQEYTIITTTTGDLESKRTATNPDFAAALVRLVASLGLPRGTPVVIVLSGSFVGGNVAIIAAVEALGLRPVIVTSLGASMWGANDPEFDWLDMAALLRERGVIRAATVATVLGGEGAVGGGMDPAAVAALRQSAVRDGVPIVEVRPFPALIDALLARIDAALAGEAPGAVVNVGGALIGLGSCRESFEFPTGLTRRPMSCTAGAPGIAIRLVERGLPVVHVLNMRRLAVEFGLPIDPVPLPAPGDNNVVYGSSPGGGG